jgi:molybdopterin synthase catalytic subunit/molybdopterin converting factor small subunit
MQVQCLFFASLGDKVGHKQLQLDLPVGSRVADLLLVVEKRFPVLVEYRGHFQVALDLEITDTQQELRDGCEVGLLPAVSGGDSGPDLVRLSEQPIDPDECVRAVQRSDCGAVVLFLGTVRASHLGQPVVRIDYSAYEAMALREMERLACECRELHPVGRLALWHRTGPVLAGEASVAIAVSTPHREGAFASARWLIDEVKSRVPIWKREVGPDGAVWIEGDARTPAGPGPLA